MRFPARAGGFLLAVLACAAPARAAAPEARDLGAFRAIELAPGIHLLRPASDRPAATNSLVVEREDGILVVDAQPSPDAARALLAAIERLSAKPVRFLVLSHPHAESIGGAAAFPDSVVVVASRGARDALADAAYDPSAELHALATAPEGRAAPAVRAPVLVVRAPTGCKTRGCRDRRRKEFRVRLLTRTGTGRSQGSRSPWDNRPVVCKNLFPECHHYRPSSR